MSKVKVLIEHEDGHKQEFNGDTVICFTVSKAGEFLNGKAKIIEAQASFIDREIPDVIYAETVGNLIASLIEESGKKRSKCEFQPSHGGADFGGEKQKDQKRAYGAGKERCL